MLSWGLPGFLRQVSYGHLRRGTRWAVRLRTVWPQGVEYGVGVLTDAVVKYASKELEVNSGAFVDDFLNARE